MDVAQLRREVGDPGRGGDVHAEPRMPEDLELVGERGPVVHERERLVGALVDRLTPREASGTRDPRRPTDAAADLDLVGSPAAGVRRTGEPELELPAPFVRPAGFEAPLAGVCS